MMVSKGKPMNKVTARLLYSDKEPFWAPNAGKSQQRDVSKFANYCSIWQP